MRNQKVSIFTYEHMGLVLSLSVVSSALTVNCPLQKIDKS